MRTANFKSAAIAALLSMGLLTGCTNGITNQKTSNHMDTLNLTQEWDKKFPQSDKVNHRKVTFKNRYGITLAADLYEPKNIESKLPAIAVSGPFGAVKEQSSGLYAQTMAERGFLTLAFDPSYTGESGGEPRNVASPDINTEDFSAAVDFLIAHPNVDAKRIGIIGICGFGGMGLNAAAMDTRIKATVASTMYDMSRVNANGYFDAEDSAEVRRNKREAMNAIRTRDAQNGTATPGTPGLPTSIKGCVIALALIAVYFAGYLNPDLMVVEVSGQTVNLMTAVSLVMLAAFTAYAVDVIGKLKDMLLTATPGTDQTPAALPEEKTDEAPDAPKEE